MNITVSYEYIDSQIKEAIKKGMQPVNNPITAALNAAGAVGAIHALMFLYDHHVNPDYIDCLVLLHDKYKSDIDTFLNIENRLYKN